MSSKIAQLQIDNADLDLALTGLSPRGVEHSTIEQRLRDRNESIENSILFDPRGYFQSQTAPITAPTGTSLNHLDLQRTLDESSVLGRNAIRKARGRRVLFENGQSSAADVLPDLEDADLERVLKDAGNTSGLTLGQDLSEKVVEIEDRRGNSSLHVRDTPTQRPQVDASQALVQEVVKQQGQNIIESVAQDLKDDWGITDFQKGNIFMGSVKFLGELTGISDIVKGVKECANGNWLGGLASIGLGIFGVVTLGTGTMARTAIKTGFKVAARIAGRMVIEKASTEIAEKFVLTSARRVAVNAIKELVGKGSGETSAVFAKCAKDHLIKLMDNVDGLRHLDRSVLERVHQSLADAAEQYARTRGDRIAAGVVDQGLKRVLRFVIRRDWADSVGRKAGSLLYSGLDLTSEATTFFKRVALTIEGDKIAAKSLSKVENYFGKATLSQLSASLRETVHSTCEKVMKKFLKKSGLVRHTRDSVLATLDHVRKSGTAALASELGVSKTTALAMKLMIAPALFVGRTLGGLSMVTGLVGGATGWLAAPFVGFVRNKVFDRFIKRQFTNEITQIVTKDLLDNGLEAGFKAKMRYGLQDLMVKHGMEYAALKPLEEAAERGLKEGLEAAVRRLVRIGVRQALKAWRRGAPDLSWKSMAAVRSSSVDGVAIKGDTVNLESLQLHAKAEEADGTKGVLRKKKYRRNATTGVLEEEDEYAI